MQVSGITSPCSSADERLDRCFHSFWRGERLFLAPDFAPRRSVLTLLNVLFPWKLHLSSNIYRASNKRFDGKETGKATQRHSRRILHHRICQHTVPVHGRMEIRLRACTRPCGRVLVCILCWCALCIIQTLVAAARTHCGAWRAQLGQHLIHAHTALPL